MTRVEQFEHIRRDHRLEQLSIRALARKHKVHRRVVREALASAVPPPRKETPRRAPVMGPYEATIRAWLIADREAPRKQRHTARRVWTRLVTEEGASLPESTVRASVRRIRAEIGQPQGLAMVPQVHEPGREAEVDFGEIWAVIAGVMVKLWLFSLRLTASGRACHRAFATQAQEAFFAGHVDAFDRLGGVPGRMRTENVPRNTFVQYVSGASTDQPEGSIKCCDRRRQCLVGDRDDHPEPAPCQPCTEQHGGNPAEFFPVCQREVRHLL